jgi:hypothetical protein
MLDDAISPLRGPEIDAAMRSSLTLRVIAQSPNPTQREFVSLHADLDRTHHTSLASIAFGFRAEFLRDGDVRETISLRPRPGDRIVGSGPRPFANSYLTRIAAHELTTAETVSQWSLRVRGDPESALYDWDMPRYWAGEFTVPLAEVIERR